LWTHVILNVNDLDETQHKAFIDKLTEHLNKRYSRKCPDSKNLTPISAVIKKLLASSVAEDVSNSINDVSLFKQKNKQTPPNAAPLQKAKTFTNP
jgi:hypothetical protein